MDARLDERFSEPGARPTAWQEAWTVLERAELYWLTTVRKDGRPHVTPLVGVAVDGAMHFTTGMDEQKARNLEHSRSVALTTGANAWASGLDVVVEGSAGRLLEGLEAIAEAFEAKYGSAWHFDVHGDLLSHGAGRAGVFRITASKVIAFAKDPHAQTTFRF